MPTARCRALLAVAGVLLLWGVPAAAQVSVAPEAVEVNLASGETAEVVLSVSNAGADSSGFALSLAPAPSADDPPEPPGTVLFTSENICCGFGDITSTPDGRLFVEKSGDETLEFTSELEFVREFDVDALDPRASIVGVAYDADHGTLWWLEVHSDDVTEEAILVEGTTEGEATGRTLPAPWDPAPHCGRSSGFPASLVYDARTTAEATGGMGRFFHLDITHDTIWAVDSLGEAAPGYPVTQTDYAGIPQPFNEEGCMINRSLDAHAFGGEPVAGEPVLEVLTGYPFVHPKNRAYTVVVTDRQGRNRGAETPLFDLPVPDGFGDVLRLGGVVRSRLDPSVLYLTVRTGFAGASARYLGLRGACRAAAAGVAAWESNPVLGRSAR